MTSYNPRSIFQAYEQYGKAQSRRNDKKTTGLGGRGNIVEKPGERKRYNEDQKPNIDQKIWSAAAKWMGMTGGKNEDTKVDTPIAMKVYGRPEFNIPKQEPVTTTALPPVGGYDEAGMNIGANFGTSMGVDANDPRGRDQRKLPTIPPSKVYFGASKDSPVSTASPRQSGIMTAGAQFGPGDPESAPVQSLINTLTTGPKQAGLGQASNTYKVVGGDTLSEIARDFGTTVEELVKINNLSDTSGDTIQTGQTLKIKADATSTTEDGTTTTDATEAAATFSSAVESTYTDFVDSKEEGDKPHVGQEGAITLTGGVVADNIYYDGKKVTSNTGYTTANFDASKLDTSKATKKVGNKTIKRSSYDSDADFTKAVIEEFENVVKAGAGDDYEDLSEGAKKAMIKLAYNNGPDWAKYNTSKALYKEMGKETKDLSKVKEGILNYSTVVGSGASIGVAKARANAYNSASDEHGGADITKIVADNTGTKTKFKYYDAAGNLVHTETTSRAPSIYASTATTVEKDSEGNW